ncbi:Histidinol-phosphate aminotransferase [Schizosaccharomyces pombe]|uniref:Histidinol-phosphate aminotransferase n=1 Tax=Schizosaccharomyces pombe (strain 972 / ATCC 24843) TaxID=284812 RepID=HIS8_SCHPO|nr:bifunctional histidinol-phosphate aminotransferase/imidazole acetol phosphate transaminase His3 [Schizosaccharomyces pombe]P36605.1 RecName: Full=Histidinol-phosphate aminotransferase; AltName: Full=Imidazole acetol-phosphate transaminase [Schizosaccharomyces pombe 972h-]ACD03192.1 His3 [Tagging vector pFA6a-his3-P3nmt1-3FLAG]ACD03195.1 His3 [Tagging vector pFA6a-his3-P41nmt1-3FLAG]ACD03198.1 His3 [Tagging vector pFA6a-his3-P81nmt1-3FLAG]AAA67316.1 imidazoleglycerol-phosphate dehydratase [S|eukprot:NP_595622.1 bifunctional histidinol-phosphate aminotransferase/imidazole acetol phosphate transaminase His3 [Schizosaccharomyces pombe]
MFDLNTCLRKNILELQPYRCARDDFSEGVLLDANECAYGSVISVDGVEFNRYPDPRQIEVKQRLCDLRNKELSITKPLTPDNICMGVGSDEIIDSLIRISCIPGKDKILMCPPSYGMYTVSAKINDVEVVKVLLEPDFNLNVDAICETLSKDSAIKVFFACSPGNPTAKALKLEDIKKILEHPTWNGIVVVDEAYIDFSAPDMSALTLVNEYPNLAVCQTLSKSFGLAGIRIGFCLTSKPIATIMNSLKAPYNISEPTSRLALDALSPQSIDKMHTYRDAIIQQRVRLCKELTTIKGMGKIIGGYDANFILIQVLDRPEGGKPSNDAAKYLYLQMATMHKVVVRFRGTEPLCEGALRITVGTEEENTILLKTIKLVLQEYYTKK